MSFAVDQFLIGHKLYLRSSFGHFYSVKEASFVIILIDHVHYFLPAFFEIVFHSHHLKRYFISINYKKVTAHQHVIIWYSYHIVHTVWTAWISYGVKPLVWKWNRRHTIWVIWYHTFMLLIFSYGWNKPDSYLTNKGSILFGTFARLLQIGYACSIIDPQTNGTTISKCRCRTLIWNYLGCSIGIMNSFEQENQR